MPPEAFEPAIPAKTYALDSAAIGIVSLRLRYIFHSSILPQVHTNVNLA
jgi:hypothetical protein